MLNSNITDSFLDSQEFLGNFENSFQMMKEQSKCIDDFPKEFLEIIRNTCLILYCEGYIKGNEDVLRKLKK